MSILAIKEYISQFMNFHFLIVPVQRFHVIGALAIVSTDRHIRSL